MIEVSPYGLLPLARLLAVVLAAGLAAVVLLALTGPRRFARRLLFAAGVAGVLCAVGSAALWSARGAGTGTQTTWGWPRPLYTRWTSWETPERRAAVRWQGVIENAVFYGALALLGGSLLYGLRSRAIGGR